ncbi:MAG: lysylphosphatidylglycerol synthase domain-containing protein, partial [Vulcanococcus sp.]
MRSNRANTRWRWGVSRWPRPCRLVRRRRHQWADQGLLQGAELAPGEPASLLPGHGFPGPPLLAELAFVLLRFGGFACCVQAFDLGFSLGWGGWLAGFAMAWTAGLVVPGAPGGLGVFEAVLLLRLTAVVPEAPLLAVAISYRLVTAAADLLA